MSASTRTKSACGCRHRHGHLKLGNLGWRRPSQSPQGRRSSTSLLAAGIDGHALSAAGTRRIAGLDRVFAVLRMHRVGPGQDDDFFEIVVQMRMRGLSLGCGTAICAMRKLTRELISTPARAISARHRPSRFASDCFSSRAITRAPAYRFHLRRCRPAPGQAAEDSGRFLGNGLGDIGEHTHAFFAVARRGRPNQPVGAIERTSVNTGLKVRVRRSRSILRPSS